jgi:hypothetical protein
MKLDFCAVCGSIEDLQNHHWKPRSMGGGDEETNFLTLCWKHHCEIHGNLQSYMEGISHRDLVRLGKEKSKHPVKINYGSKGNLENLQDMNFRRSKDAKNYSKKFIEMILDYKNKGKTHREICSLLNKDGYCSRNGGELYPVHITRFLNYGRV